VAKQRNQFCCSLQHKHSGLCEEEKNVMKMELSFVQFTDNDESKSSFVSSYSRRGKELICVSIWSPKLANSFDEVPSV
jgi:hypothetical protein